FELNSGVRERTGITAGHLVEHYSGVREGVSLTLRAAAEKDRAHGGGPSDADGCDIALDDLHSVIYGKASGDAAAGAVDVEVDVAVGILAREDEELGDDEVCEVIVDGVADEDDAVLQKAGVDVVGSLATGALLHDHRYYGLDSLRHRILRSKLEIGS